jgi:hypothetical protein
MNMLHTRAVRSSCGLILPQIKQGLRLIGKISESPGAMDNDDDGLIDAGLILLIPDRLWI